MNMPQRWLTVTVPTALLGSIMTLVPASRTIAAPPDAEVEAVQMPAWLTRDGKRVPLAIGAQLKNGDTITTGDGSRVLLRLAEGSAVKLGENARFELNDMSQSRDGGEQRFNASLAVLQGAFRFTTAPGDKARSKRSVDVKLPTLTASVTGTDLWGKSAEGREIVALIDGNITLSRKGAAPITMNEARTVYVMQPDAPPPAVVKITLAQLNAFAQETEMQPGAGAASKIGNWKIYAARTTSQEEALAIYERVRDAGYAAAIQPAVSQGKQIYQVRIVGLLTEADGVAVAIKLRVQLGLQDVRVALQ